MDDQNWCIVSWRYFIEMKLGVDAIESHLKYNLNATSWVNAIYEADIDRVCQCSTSIGMEEDVISDFLQAEMNKRQWFEFLLLKVQRKYN